MNQLDVSWEAKGHVSCVHYGFRQGWVWVDRQSDVFHGAPGFDGQRQFTDHVGGTVPNNLGTHNSAAVP